MKDSFCEKERKRFEKLNKFQFGYKFKRVGWSIVIIAFALMIAKRFVDEPLWVKPILSNIFIIGLLMVSLSKEKVEDEFMDSLRAQSYRFAFITGVLYSLIQPYVNYSIDYLIDGDDAEVSFGYFQVLVFMLIVQVLSFHQMKRIYS